MGLKEIQAAPINIAEYHPTRIGKIPHQKYTPNPKRATKKRIPWSWQICQQKTGSPTKKKIGSSDFCWEPKGEEKASHVLQLSHVTDLFTIYPTSYLRTVRSCLTDKNCLTTPNFNQHRYIDLYRFSSYAHRLYWDLFVFCFHSLSTCSTVAPACNSKRFDPTPSVEFVSEVLVRTAPCVPVFQTEGCRPQTLSGHERSKLQ